MLRGGWRCEWRESAGWFLAAILLAVIVFGYLMPVTGYFTAVPGDLADPRYNSVVLEHLYRFVIGSAKLWNPDFYFPFEGALAFSDTHFGSGATYVLARLLGLSREHAFDAWFAGGTLFNFASALYVIRRLGLTTAAAALGAFFFAFALPVTGQDTHAQLVHRFAAPLAVLALWQMFERRRLADLARLSFFTVWQFYCSIYLGLFLVYLLAALAIALLILRRPFEWPLWRANLAAERVSLKAAASGVLLLSTLAVIHLLFQYYLVSRTYSLWRPFGTEMLPRLGSYLLADYSPLLRWLGRDFSVGDVRHEHQMFIGFGAIALILAAIVWRRHAPVPVLTQAMLIALGLLFAGTLGIGEFSLYYLIAWLPGIEAIRAVSRIVLIMLIPMSVLVALGADAAWRRVRRPLWGLPMLAGLAAVVIVEPLSVSLGSVPIANWQARLDAARGQLPLVVPRDAILLLRYSSADPYEQILVELDAVLLGQDLGYPVLNGYSNFHPPGYGHQACASAKGRLRSYFLFMGGRVDVSSYERRVVVLDLGAACPPAAQ
jgi:hypothetical protein